MEAFIRFRKTFQPVDNTYKHLLSALYSSDLEMQFYLFILVYIIACFFFNVFCVCLSSWDCNDLFLILGIFDNYV